MLNCSLTADSKPFQISAEFLTCLQDAPKAEKKFKLMPSSHQKYYSNWIESAKTIQTKAKRIGLAILSLEKNMTFAEMLKLNAQSVNK